MLAHLSSPTAIDPLATSASDGSKSSPDSNAPDFLDWMRPAPTGSIDPASDSQKTRGYQSDWLEWKDRYLRRGIDEERRQQVRIEETPFLSILQSAPQSNGLQDPLGFIHSLSTQELSTLQHMHGLADAIRPETLNEEGAMNLLKVPGTGVDLNGDGLQQVGIALTWQFPPSDAPASVREAWRKTLEGRPETDEFLLSGSFLPMTLSIDGTPSGNPFGPKTDYASLIAQVRDAAIQSRPYDQPWQQDTRDHEIRLLSELLGNVESLSN